MHQRSMSSPKSMTEPDVIQETHSSVELEPMLSNGHKRWQLLSMALRSSRAFSQARKMISDNQDAFFNTFLLRSPSYTAIDVAPECFSGIDKQRLSKLVQDKDRDYLNQLGGVQGVVWRLKSHVDKGIDSHDQGISLHQQTFGSNAIQMPSAKMLPIVLENFKDPILVLLFLSSSLSLGFGIKRDGLNGVSDGLFIFVSLFLVMAAISLSNIWARKQLHALSKSNNSISALVIRDGRKQQILTSDVVVGGLVYLQTGDQIPADGLYIDGSSFQVNESIDANYEEFPFLMSGRKVADGNARMLVTAVGIDTKWGELMSLKCLTDIRTPLQVKLHKLTQNTAKAGLAVALMVLMVLLIQYFTGNMKDASGAEDYTLSKSTHHVYRAIVEILITPIAIASTAIPEGLLLAVMITLAYSTNRMTAEKAMVRNLAACEMISSISVICIDKSGTISSNSPEVEQFWLGQMNSTKKRRHPLIDEKVIQLIHEGIGLNTTSESSSDFDEIRADDVIRAWAVQELGMNLYQLKGNCCVLDADGLNLPQGSICIRRKIENMVYIHMKGSVDMILALCSHYFLENGERKGIDASAREKLMKTIQEMKNDGLNCIVYAHAHAHAASSRDLGDNQFHRDLRAQDLTLIGLVGLKDMFLRNISNGLREFKQAGVDVIMMTTEDVPKAKESALRCGVFGPNETMDVDGNIIEGTQFRNYTEEERNERVKKVRVIAKASASDKHLLMQCLKKEGHRVAVIGGSPGDEKVFEEADVSFFYPGIQESQSMKEKSDIIITGDSFNPIASAMRWGRGMHNNIQIFAQFQLTATIVSLVTDSLITVFGGEPPTINIVTVISSGEIPFAALQILWVKLIVGTLVVLALSIDDPAESLVQLMPVNQRGPFVTNVMWRDIIGQGLCQITVLLIIQFKGESTFKLNAREKDTLIFNIFVLCQIFTIFNRVRGKNIVERLTKKRLFWMVIGIIILLQVVIVELLKRFAGTERLNWKHWRACIGIATLSWLIGWLLRKIPVPEKPLFFPYL